MTLLFDYEACRFWVTAEPRRSTRIASPACIELQAGIVSYEGSTVSTTDKPVFASLQEN
jgi:hypothetical protein